MDRILNEIIVDSILYNGEADIFDLRFQIMSEFVEHFYVIEFCQYFSGGKKKTIDNFPYYNHQKVTYIFINRSIEDDVDIKFFSDFIRHVGILSDPRNIPERQRPGASSFERDYFQREYAAALTLSKFKNRKDVVFHFSDCDEIPFNLDGFQSNTPCAINMHNAQGYINRVCKDAPWHGSLLLKIEDFKKCGLNDWRIRSRTNSIQTKFFSGVHLSSPVPIDRIRRKLAHTAHVEYNDFVTRNYLKFSLQYGYDFFWRRKIIYSESDVTLPRSCAKYRIQLWKGRNRNSFTWIYYLLGLLVHKIVRRLRGY